MSDAEKLANDIAQVSKQIENVSECTRMYINTANNRDPKTREGVPPEGCFEELKESMLAVLRKHRAKLIIELAEASGMRPGSEPGEVQLVVDRLAIGEGAAG